LDEQLIVVGWVETYSIESDFDAAVAAVVFHDCDFDDVLNLSSIEILFSYNLENLR